MRTLGLLFALLFSISIFADDLYISKNANGKSCEELPHLLLKEYKRKTSAPILFFIHGRGKHPEKGLAYLPNLEERYGINVIMFHWDSWINAISRPEQSAQDAAARFAICLDEIERFKTQEPEVFNKRPLLFMSHSMGNIVLKTLVENNLFKSRGSIFESMILNAADVPLDEHKEWIEKISLSKNVFITFNSNDAVLIGSKFIDYKDGDFFSGRRLGRAKSSVLKKREMAKNAKYLDFSDLTFAGHQHFLDDGKNSQLPLTRIFEDILYGKNRFSTLYRLNRENQVYEFQRTASN